MWHPQGNLREPARGLGTPTLRQLRHGHLLARLGFDQRGVAVELGGHFQQLFAHGVSVTRSAMRRARSA